MQKLQPTRRVRAPPQPVLLFLGRWRSEAASRDNYESSEPGKSSGFDSESSSPAPSSYGLPCKRVGKIAATSAADRTHTRLSSASSNIRGSSGLETPSAWPTKSHNVWKLISFSGSDG